MGSRQTRLRELFDTVCRLEGAAREAYLSSLPQSDRELRDEVLSLLEYDREGEDILDKGVVDLARPEFEAALQDREVASPFPQQLGDYTLVGCIAEGGMGTVYEAIQKSPRRSVAIKCLRVGREDRTSLRRFELEGETLGRLDHPGIARIYEFGVEDGRPYIVMERVAGVPLTDFAEGRALSIRDRLSLLIRVCEAVHHAHQKGVIHRDLKPPNILVDAEGQPKVVDFGVARLRDESLDLALTGAGQCLGTLAYMSPEQARGERDSVDVRSDVYSLGVIAYELLSGTLPHDLEGLSFPKALDRVRLGDPVALHRVAKNLDRDIVSIVHKASSPECINRYASVKELADDWRRYLQREPVYARSPNLTYVLGKFLRRYRALALMSASVVLSLAMGLSVALIALKEARESEERAEDRAEALALSQESVDQVSDFLQGLLLSPIDHGMGIDASLKEALDVTAKTIDEKIDSKEAMARVSHLVGKVYLHFGIAERSVFYLRRASSLFDPPRLGTHEKALECRRDLAEALRIGNHVEEALEILETLSVEAAKLLPVDDDLSLRIQGTLSMTLVALGSYERAREVRLEVLAIQSRAYGEDHGTTLSSKNNLALLEAEEGHWEKACALWESVLEVRLREQGTQNPKTLITLQNVGVAFKKLKRYAEAEKLFGLAFVWQRQLLGLDHPDTLRTVHNLATLFYEQRRFGKCLPLLRYCRTRFEMKFGQDHPHTLGVMAYQGAIALDTGDAREGVGIFQEVLTRRTQALGPLHLMTLSTYPHLARGFEVLGAFDEAEEALMARLDGLFEREGEESERFLKAVRQVCKFYRRHQREDQALAFASDWGVCLEESLSVR